VGARVTVTTDVLRRTKVVQAGSGFISQNSKELLFGLGQSRRIVTVEIRWPSGLTQTFPDLPLGHRVFVEEGNDAARPEPFRKPSGPPSSAPPLVVSEGSERLTNGVWLYRPVPAPDFSRHDLSGQERSLASLRGRPALLLFWSTAAPPSVRALAELSGQSSAFATASVPVIAAAVDEVEDVGMCGARTIVGVTLAGEKWQDLPIPSLLFDRREDLRCLRCFSWTGTETW
jgi:hypothetical protein